MFNGKKGATVKKVVVVVVGRIRNARGCREAKYVKAYQELTKSTIPSQLSLLFTQPAEAL